MENNSCCIYFFLLLFIKKSGVCGPKFRFVFCFSSSKAREREKSFGKINCCIKIYDMARTIAHEIEVFLSHKFKNKRILTINRKHFSRFGDFFFIKHILNLLFHKFRHLLAIYLFPFVGCLLLLVVYV